MTIRRVVYLGHPASMFVERWANAMSKRGYKIHLVTMHPVDASHPIDNSVDVHQLPFPPPLGYFLNTLYLKRLLNEINPCFLHSHYASGYGTLSRLVGFTPSLLSVWGSDVLLFPYQSKMAKRILCLNLSAVDYIAATSITLKRQAEKFVNPRHPITVTPFGIDYEQFKPLIELRNPDEFVVGVVKGLLINNGIQYLIKAFALVKNRYQGTKRLKLVIVGDGPYKKHLLNLALTLRIESEIEFQGFIPHADIPKILNKFSVFVNVPDSEGFGVAVLEASACGIPVIVSAVGALPEIVEDNVTGFIVPKGNPEEIAKVMMMFLENENLSESMGISGRHFVEQHYNWNDSITIMDELYKTILANV